MQIVTREEWGAAPPKSRPSTIVTPTDNLWLHHTAGALDAGGNGVWWDDMRGIQEFHQTKWSDIGYSFCIGGGLAWEGRGVGIRGAHTAHQNSLSHGICFIGNYQWMNPTRRDIEAAADLLRHGAGKWWTRDAVRRLSPHRDAPHASTACCGKNLIAAIPDIVTLALKPWNPPEEEDDMRLIIKGDEEPEWWITDGITKRWVKSREHAQKLVFFAKLQSNNPPEAFVWPQEDVDAIPTID